MRHGLGSVEAACLWNLLCSTLKCFVTGLSGKGFRLDTESQLVKDRNKCTVRNCAKFLPTSASVQTYKKIDVCIKVKPGRSLSVGVFRPSGRLNGPSVCGGYATPVTCPGFAGLCRRVCTMDLRWCWGFGRLAFSCDRLWWLSVEMSALVKY